MVNLSYFDVLLRCPMCDCTYSPKLRVCPNCGERVSDVKRRKVANRVKAERVVEALGGSRVTSESIHQAMYRRPSRNNKYLSSRQEFVDRALKALEGAECIAQDKLGFIVLKKPSVDEVYGLLWKEKNVSKKRDDKKSEEKQVRYVDVVKEGDRWVRKRKIKVGDIVKRFFLINSAESVKVVKKIASQNPDVNYNCMFTNGFRSTLKNADKLLLAVPNVGILACSEYTYWERLRGSLADLFHVLVMPVGGVKRWIDTAYRLVHESLSDGCSLGLVCERLYSLGIKISVRGLLKWRWREIKGPPPVFVW